MKRRTFLKATTAAAGVAGAALMWRAWDQGVFSTGEGPAYDAWKTWNRDEGAPRRLIRAAILAANPHNTQPWRFRVASERIDLFSDPARNIGTIDPFRREMHIGLGCALENLALAATAEGFEHRIALFPNRKDNTHIAQVALSPGNKIASPLYAAIPRRHTNRGPYDTTRTIDVAVLDELKALGADLPQVSVQWLTDLEARRYMGDLIVQAAEAIIADREQSRDSAAWFRGSWQELQAKADGLTVDAQALPGYMRVAAKMLPPVSQEQADRIWLDTTRNVHVATAAAFGVLVVRDATSNLQRVQGGRLWQRMHLYAETKGIAMHPLNQLPERADREQSLRMEPRFGKVLKELSGGARWHALMPFRLGYPTRVALSSPRRRVEDVLIA